MGKRRSPEATEGARGCPGPPAHRCALPAATRTLLQPALPSLTTSPSRLSARSRPPAVVGATPAAASLVIKRLIGHPGRSAAGQAAGYPLLCLAASLLSLSSAMVSRMPFPRGREIHGLLPCSKAEVTSHREAQTAARASPRWDGFHPAGDPKEAVAYGQASFFHIPGGSLLKTSPPTPSEFICAFPSQSGQPEAVRTTERSWSFVPCAPRVERSCLQVTPTTPSFSPQPPKNRRGPAHLQPVLAYLANHKNVREPGGKAVAVGVLHVNHVERAGVPLPVGDHPDTAQVGATSHHAQVT